MAMIVSKVVKAVVTDEENTLTVQFTGEMGKPDKDGDVFAPGAYKSSAKVPLADFNHANSAPIGVGVLERKGKVMQWRGEILDTTAAQDAYKGIKAMGESQEYSYRFVPVKAAPRRDADHPFSYQYDEVEVFEVSPVFKGASYGTHTISAKRTADDAFVKGMKALFPDDEDDAVAESEAAPVDGDTEAAPAAESVDWTPVLDIYRKMYGLA